MATQSNIYTKAADWEQFINQMHSGDTLEIDEEMFNYFLEVLPPVFMGKVINGQWYSFGFAEGAETVVGFRRGRITEYRGTSDPLGYTTRYFCRDLGVMNPNA